MVKKPVKNVKPAKNATPAKNAKPANKAPVVPAIEPSAGKVVESTDNTQPEQKPEVKKPDLNKDNVKHAIAQGKALIKEGKSKADAARLIYATIKDEGKEVIVAAFIEGATLTEKGALTYWYNCRRRADKEEKKSS
ncbi:MAG: hypothetical protein WBW94_10650 [Anaerolineales bacterium]